MAALIREGGARRPAACAERHSLPRSRGIGRRGMRWRSVAVLGCLFLSAVAAPADGQAPVRSMAEILDQSPASDWRALDPENTLYMELPGGRVIIELSPDFSPEHMANVRALARAHYWDGAAITRVQDNYVTQWGRAEGDAHDRGAARADIAAPEYDRPARGLPFTR